MRSYVVFVVLLALLGTLGGLLATRTRVAVVLAVAPGASANASAPATLGDAGVAVDGHLVAPARDASSGVDAGPPRIERSMRVVGLGWELLAPALVANGGAIGTDDSTFAREGLTLRVAPLATEAAVEDALARGGGDANGADVAVLPLATFVASYERLRALEPEVFFVTAFSRGREGIHAVSDEPFLRGTLGGDPRVTGARGSPSAFLTLFALDFAGVPLDRIDLVEPDAQGVLSGTIVSVDRAADREGVAGALIDSRMRFTTADAPRVIPIVAIAAHGTLEQRADALRAFSRGWIAGAQRLARDVPEAARAIASLPTAPSAVTLLHRLGLVESATLRDNARLAGLSGRGAVTLERLFARGHRLWRAVGVLHASPPDRVPVSTGVIAALVRADTSLARAEPSRAPLPSQAPAPTTPSAVPSALASAPAGAVPLLTHRETNARYDESAFADEVGFIAGIFERATVRLSFRGGDTPRARAFVANVRDRFDLGPSRLVLARTAPAGAAATIEVLVVP